MEKLVSVKTLHVLGTLLIAAACLQSKLLRDNVYLMLLFYDHTLDD